MDLVEYFKELQRHDWYYEYSDDHKVWEKGKNNLKRIQAVAQESEVCYECIKTTLTMYSIKCQSQVLKSTYEIIRRIIRRHQNLF